jgi:DNA-binding GntR family transcriptional regulator
MANRGIASEETKTYDKLKLLILGGQIARGQPLVERSVAERLGVSRTPVRETIVRLEREGLVRIVEGKGAFVATYTLEDMIEIYQVREGLEPVAARLSCKFIQDEDLDYFEERLHRYKSKPSLRDDDPEAYRRFGKEFHSLFIRASNNARLIGVIEGIQDQIELFRGLSRTISPRAATRSAVDEHIEILNALKARAPQRAERAVRIHLKNGLKLRIDGLQKHGAALR